MKILVLNYEFPPLGGGASPVSYEISKGLVIEGNEVDVVTMGYKDLPAYEKVDGINIYRIKCLRKMKEICYPYEQLTYLINAKMFLKKHLKNNDYDICHCHFIIPTGVLALWVKKKYRIDYIITAHGSDVPGFNTDRFQVLHYFTPPFLKIICKEAKKITTPSEYLKDLIISKVDSGIDEKIIALPNGSKDFMKKGIEKENVIYSCGRLLKRKGFQYLIQSFNLLKKKDWRLYIVGDGPYKEELRKVANGNKNIVFTGWLSHNDKSFIEIMNKSKIFSLLSMSESQGIVYLEAMSAGCAILSSNITACRETVSDNVGHLVKRDDIEEVSDKLKEMIDNEKKLTVFMKNSRKRYDKNYVWDGIIKKYMKLY